MKNIFKIFSLFLMAVAIQWNVSGQKQETWTRKKADQWFASGSWNNGFKVKAHPSTNTVEFAKQYHKNKALWDKAFAFLRDSDLLKLSVGKHVIDGDNVFVSVTENPTKEFKDTKFEAHKKYIDLQYVVKGKEKMGVCPVAKATVKTPYDEKKEVGFYDCNDGKYYEANPSVYFLFFPQDAHRPNIMVDKSEVDKKIVVKIKVAE